MYIDDSKGTESFSETKILKVTLLFHITYIYNIYYPPEVSSMKYCCLGVFRKEYSRHLTKWCK